MPGASKPLLVPGMKDCRMIEHRRPADPPFGKGVSIGMKAQGGNFRALQADWKQRMRRFEMKNCRRRIRTPAKHIVKRGIERNRILGTEKLDAAPAKRFRVTWNQLPMMLFAAEAEDGHAVMRNGTCWSTRGSIIQRPALEACCSCCAAIISAKMLSRLRVILQFG